jgi:hypothetical protein
MYIIVRKTGVAQMVTFIPYAKDIFVSTTLHLSRLYSCLFDITLVDDKPFQCSYGVLETSLRKIVQQWKSITYQQQTRHDSQPRERRVIEGYKTPHRPPPRDDAAGSA